MEEPDTLELADCSLSEHEVGQGLQVQARLRLSLWGMTSRVEEQRPGVTLGTAGKVGLRLCPGSPGLGHGVQGTMSFLHASEMQREPVDQNRTE